MGYCIYPGKKGANDFAGLLQHRSLPFTRQGEQFYLEVDAGLLEALADYIYGDYCKYHLAESLQREVEDLEPAEGLQVAQEGLALLTGAPSYPTYRRRIIMLLAIYLAKNDTLHIPGFVTFRLPELKEALAGAAFSLGEEYSWQREYQDFVHLLRLQLKAPSGLIHVFCGESEGFLLKNERYQVLEPMEYCPPLPADRFGTSEDDLLVSSLISLSPAKIKLHRRDCLKDSTYRLLEDIFGRKVMP